MADMMSMAGRKNPFAAVEAYAAAFAGSGADVQMIVKISNADRDDAGETPGVYRALQGLLARRLGVAP